MREPLWKHSIYCAYREGEDCTCKERVRPRIEAGCPACEFIVDTCRTTRVGGCGKHDNNDPLMSLSEELGGF